MSGERTSAKMDYLLLLRRVALYRWKLVLVVFVLAAAPVAAWAMLMVPKTFDATASIFIEDVKTGPQSGILRDWLPPSDATMQNAMLRSRSMAETVTESLSREATEELLQRAMHRNYLLEFQNAIRRLLGREVVVHSPRQRILAELQRSRVGFTSSQPGEVRITAVAYQPTVAMELANLYVEVLQARNRSHSREEARATREFLENSLNQTRLLLQESEEALSKIQGGSSKLPDRVALETARLAQMENTLVEIQINREIARTRLAVLKGAPAADSKPSAGVVASLQNVRERQLGDRLATLRDDLAKLRQRYTDEHPLVLANVGEIKELEARMKTEGGGVAPPPPPPTQSVGDRAVLAKQIGDLEIEVSALEAREEALKPRVTRLSRELSSGDADEIERGKIVRRVQAQRNLYEMLSEKLGTARIQEQAERPGIRVIDLAPLPTSPSSSSTMNRLFFGLVASFGLGMAVAALLEFQKLPVDTEADVERLTGLPILGWLPVVPPPPGPRPAKDAGPVSFVDSPTAPAIAVEGLRSVRTMLELMSHDDKIRTVMIASAGPSEGKSTILLNLGWVFWERGQRVLLIDSDLRRPTLHRALKQASSPGLSDILTGQGGLSDVRHTVQDGFDFVAAGVTTTPGALLSRDNIARLLTAAKETAEVVLFDTAPVLAVSDNLVLASMVDGVILVVRNGHTPRRDVVRAKEHLDKVGASLLGVVINRVSRSATQRHYAPYAESYTPSGLASPTERVATLKGWTRRLRGVALVFLRSAMPVLLACLVSVGSAEAQGAEEEHTIGVDDLLQVQVWDNKELDRDVQVRLDGKVALPLAGEVQAAGLTATGLAASITERLAKSVKNPSVSVLVKEIRSFRVFVVGQVNKPGVYPIKAGTPLLQALTLAGGLTERAEPSAAYVVRGAQSIPVDLQRLIQDADLSHNPVLQTDDTVVVPEAVARSNPQEVLDSRIYLLGKVQKPGVYTIRQDVPVLHAIFLAGGLADGGDLGAAFIVRDNKRIPFDLRRLIQKGDVLQNLMVRREDTIVIPEGGEMQNSVFIMGEIAKPGAYPRTEVLTLMKLVSLAGGFTKFAAAGRITLIRENGADVAGGETKPRTKSRIKIDVDAISRDPGRYPDLPLEAGDVVVVPQTLF